MSAMGRKRSHGISGFAGARMERLKLKNFCLSYSFAGEVRNLYGKSCPYRIHPRGCPWAA